MADLVPVARVAPGFESGKIPWISFPCDSCKWPKTYALKIEPRWDSCDGRASTAGWDAAVVQIGFDWTGAGRDLVATVGSRLISLGWAPGPDPSWSGDQAAYMTWDYPRGQAPSETLTVDSPIDGLSWMMLIEAKPVGALVDCSR